MSRTANETRGSPTREVDWSRIDALAFGGWLAIVDGSVRLMLVRRPDGPRVLRIL